MAEINKLQGPLGIYVVPDNDLHVHTSTPARGLSISGDGGNSPGFLIHSTTVAGTAPYLVQNILALKVNDGSAGTAIGDYLLVNKKNFAIHLATNDTIRFTLDNAGVLKSTTGTYDALVIDDNDIPNKKYVDDVVALAGGLWTANGSDIYYNTGNVGIGTTGPAYLLHTKSTFAGNKWQIVTDNSNVNRGLAIGSSTLPNIVKIQAYAPSLGPDGSGQTLSINANGGNVGIGTTSPDELLDVNGSAIVGLSAVNSNTTKLYLNNNNGKVWALSSGTNNISESYFGIYNWTDDTTYPKVTIDTAGDVGIGLGASAPSEKLHVGGNIRGQNIYAYDPNNTARIGAMTSFYSATSSAENAAFGNTQSEVYLKIYSDGHAVINDELTATDFLLSSDRDLKTEIDYKLKDVTIDGLKPTSFLIKGKFKYGFIAQDMLETHPELVRGTKEEKESGEIDYYSIKENSILPIVVKEVQELKKEIKVLKKLIKSLI